jgi:hypothetical protein
MANIRLYPPFGTREQSSSVKFEIFDLDTDNIKVEIENVTDGVQADIKHFEKIEKGYGGVVDLNIPEHSSQSSISVFATIYESDKILQICPSIFEIKEEMDETDSNILVSPLYIGQKDLCSIKIKGEPLSSTSFSVNDKILRVMINEAGYGSIHFKGSEVVGNKELESLNKIPIYIYEGENKTKKVFSGSYVNIIPSNIAVHGVLDPRCDSNSDHYIVPGSWTLPEECEEPCDPLTDPDCLPCNPAFDPDCPCDPIKDPDCHECDPAEDPDCPCIGPDCDPKPRIPRRPCEYGNVQRKASHCRIHNSSAVLLNNGMVMHAYISPDNTYSSESDDDQYNVNRVFLTVQYTTPLQYIIANRDVVVESKTASEDFRIHVEEDTWNALNAITDLPGSLIYISLYDVAFGYQNVKINSLEIDEYTGDFIAIADAGVSNVVLAAWVFCVNAVIFDDSIAIEKDSYNFYMEGETPSNFMALPFVRNEFESGSYVQPVNISIASNYRYVGTEREAYIYIIVEAITENNLSQLYFNSMSFGTDSTFSQKTYGWVRLTDETQGNNRNPIAKIDTYNNLHVVFESDRGGINQLYYGSIGTNITLTSASVFSSSIDKYSEFLSKGELPFDYFSPLLLKAHTPAYALNPSNNLEEVFSTPEFNTRSVLSEKWNAIQSGGGSVVVSDVANYLDDIVITANPLSEEAMAITSLKILEDGEIAGSDPSQDTLNLLQYNYQISFDLEANVTQNNNLTGAAVVDSIEMERLFNHWKSEFVISIDSSVTNQPVYTGVNNNIYNGIDNNKYVIGRYDNVYDRIVPLVGSYKYDNPTNPSFVSSQIKILQTDNNLKDYTFGIMFEKTYMKATNIQTSLDYVADGYLITDYVPEITEVVYTGKAKLVAFIKTSDSSETRADYIIVREFPEELDISESSTYDIIVNYTKLESEQVENVLNTYKETYSNQFVGTLTLIIDGVPKFSQSFVTEIDTDDYNYFDIGFGVPSGGYYVADKMAPSKLGIYDNISTTLDISNITISSPTYTYNDAVVSMPPTVRDITNFKVFDTLVRKPVNTSTYLNLKPDWEDNLISLNYFAKDEIKYYFEHIERDANNFSELFSVENVEKVSIEFASKLYADRMIVTTEDAVVLHDTGIIVSSVTEPLKFDVDVTLIDNIYITVELGPDDDNVSYRFIAYFKKVHNDNGFIQVPVTFEGVNQSAALDIGICDDIHIAWQSNKSKYWDIYYSNSVNELSPFRYETQITDTESNSIKPSISVERTGKRMITWNDNRDGDYTIYAARSLKGYDCDQKSCEVKMLKKFEDNVEQCSLEFSATITEDGIYNLVIYMYSNIDNSNLYKTITLKNNESKWFIDGVSAEGLIVYDADGEFIGVSLLSDTEYVVSYIPDKDDGIFDVILYASMGVALIEETE